MSGCGPGTLITNWTRADCPGAGRAFGLARLRRRRIDSSRLLDARDLSDHRFADLPDLLEPGDLVVGEPEARSGSTQSPGAGGTITDDRGAKSPTGGKVEAGL